jgi:hypothetical protein
MGKGYGSNPGFRRHAPVSGQAPGQVSHHWIDIDSLIRIKSSIDKPRHQEDARVLREVKKRNSRSGISSKSDNHNQKIH